MVPVSLLHKLGANWVYILGRVEPGTALAPLQAKMSASLRNWLSQLQLYQKEDEKKNLAESHVVLTPGGMGIANMQQEFGTGLKFLMWISALVLLIACANIANLVLVRGMARRAETSIRMALGAQKKTADSSDAYRKCGAVVHGRPGWTSVGLTEVPGFY